MILEARAKIAKIRLHVLKFETQRRSFLRMRDNLVPGVLHLTADFGTFPTQDGAKVPDLVFVFAYLDAHGAVVTKYVDCIPFLNAAESKDWCFVETVFRGFQKASFFCGFS